MPGIVERALELLRLFIRGTRCTRAASAIWSVVAGWLHTIGQHVLLPPAVVHPDDPESAAAVCAVLEVELQMDEQFASYLSEVTADSSRATPHQSV